MVTIFVFKLQNIKTTNVTSLTPFCGYQFHRNLTTGSGVLIRDKRQYRQTRPS